MVQLATHLWVLVARVQHFMGAGVPALSIDGVIQDNAIVQNADGAARCAVNVGGGACSCNAPPLFQLA